MDTNTQVLQELADIKAEIAKIREPKKAAQQDYLNRLVKLLTEDQLAFFNKVYPTGKPKYLDVAISQVETTLKNLNRDTAKLHVQTKEAVEANNTAQAELRDANALIKKLKAELQQTRNEINRLSTPENVANADVQRQLDWLTALESAGVDNWSGYYYAREIFYGSED